MSETKTPSLIAAGSKKPIIDLRDGDGLRKHHLYGSVQVAAGDLTQVEHLQLLSASRQEEAPGGERVVPSDPGRLGGLPTRYTVYPGQDTVA